MTSEISPTMTSMMEFFKAMMDQNARNADLQSRAMGAFTDQFALLQADIREIKTALADGNSQNVLLANKVGKLELCVYGDGGPDNIGIQRRTALIENTVDTLPNQTEVHKVVNFMKGDGTDEEPGAMRKLQRLFKKVDNLAFAATAYSVAASGVVVILGLYFQSRGH